MKGHTLPGINQRSDAKKHMHCGRADSAAFQSNESPLNKITLISKAKRRKIKNTIKGVFSKKRKRGNLAKLWNKGKIGY